MARRVRNAATVEDICSDVFFLALQRFDDLAPLPERAARAWLLRASDLIGLQNWRAATRRKRAWDRLLREPIPESVPPEAESEQRDEEGRRAEIDARIAAVLADMDPRHVELLQMSAWQQMNGPAIARRLGITDQAARLRLMRARSAFRSAYRRAAQEAGWV